MSLAATVLDHCAARMGELDVRRTFDGSALVVSEPPEYLAVSLGLLDAGERISWHGDRLRFDVKPDPLYYQPIFADLFRPDAVIVCKRVESNA